MRPRDLVGVAFFAFATFVSIHSACQRPSLLAGWVALHNLILTLLYARRRPAKSSDRAGLWLGLIAALLPSAAPLPVQPSWAVTLAGSAAYALVLWSLLTLGRSFGIAPANRGLVIGGPYRLVRHPMYLGELALRLVLALSAPEMGTALLLCLALCVVQVARICREEKHIPGYHLYADMTRWRLLPGVW